jgi:hypothetical protein
VPRAPERTRAAGADPGVRGQWAEQGVVCRERGILPAAFHLWFKKRLLPTPRWAEVQVDRPETIPAPPHPGPPLELALACGVRLGVRDVRWLPDVARFIRALPAFLQYIQPPQRGQKPLPDFTGLPVTLRDLQIGVRTRLCGLEVHGALRVSTTHSPIRTALLSCRYEESWRTLLSQPAAA